MVPAVSGAGKEAVGCDEGIKGQFFYAFLRNRPLSVTPDFPFLMAK
jgi:hypothetical protein